MIAWRNVGPADRVVRAVVCVVMFTAGWGEILPPPWSAAMQVFALPGVLTAVLGWDPVYALLGISTARNHFDR